MTYSPPRAEVAEYVIYPTDYDQSPFSDTDTAFTVRVKQFSDTGKWFVDGHVWQLSRAGKWIDCYSDRLNCKKWARFDTAQQAIEMALKHVDDRPGFRSLPKILEERGIK